jgi:hypothetical protein
LTVDPTADDSSSDDEAEISAKIEALCLVAPGDASPFWDEAPSTEFWSERHSPTARLSASDKLIIVAMDPHILMSVLADGFNAKALVLQIRTHLPEDADEDQAEQDANERGGNY